MRDGWESVALGSIAETRLGKALPRGEGKSVDGARYLRNVNVRWGHVETGGLNTMSFSTVEKEELSLRRGDVLVCEGGEVGRSAVLTTDLPGVYFQNALHRLRAGARVSPHFLALSLEHLVRSGGLAGISTQVTIAHLNQAKLRALPVTLPPLYEQRRIVDLIGALDEAINAASRLADKGEATWWATADELARAVERVPAVPLGQIAEITGGLTKNKKTQDADGLIEVPYLRVANVHRRYLDLDDVAVVRVAESRAKQLCLQVGDVLLNEGGDLDKLGRGAVWRGEIPNCIHQNHVFRARITNSEFSPAFVSAWSNSFGQEWFALNGTQTTGIASISKSKLMRFPVPALDPEQQKFWVDALSAAYGLQREAEGAAEALRLLRSELLAACLSGEHEIPSSYDAVMEAAA